jgi:putative redox protein
MGLETKIIYMDGVRFQVVARKHEITSDQPLENSGTDAGMTPPELLLASLGSCAAYYAAEYLRARSISATGLTVAASAQKAQKPARLTDFKISLSVPGVDDPRHRDGILRAAKSCLIHNTLAYASTIQIELENKNAEVDQYQSELVAKH